MALRRSTMMFVAVIATVAAALPTYGAEEGIGVATSVLGSITSETAEANNGDDTPTYEVVGDCTYAGTQSGNRMVIRFGGGGLAFGPTPALGTQITCEVFTDKGDSMSRDFVLPGPVGASTDQTPSWAVAPITVCVSGTGFFGPTPVVNKTLPRACRRTLV